MAQKIKVQDGNIVYEASDPAYIVNFDINGQLIVSKNISVGDNTNTSGIITTSDNQNLTLTTGINGNLILNPSGAVIINGTTWPTGFQTVSPGSYLGASALNTLEFYSFIFAYTGSDTLTISQLNLLYPTIQPGQSVIGPTVVYQCVGSSQWRTLQPIIGYTPFPDSGGTMTGYLILNADPIVDLGAVTKQYVDKIATGVNIRGSVETSTTSISNLSSNSYTNGASGGGFDPGGQGVGATLISTANVNLNTAGVGGYITLAVGSRILVKNQLNPIQNGIYEVTILGVDGPGGTSWVLTRSSDYNNSQAYQVHAGGVAYVQEGTLGGTQWVQTSTGFGPSDQTIIGSDPIVFSQFAGAGTFTSGSGIDITGNIISNIGVLSDIAGAGISVSSATGNVTIANTGVVSAIAGTGISVSSGAGNVTVTNTGVLSFTGNNISRTGAVTLTSADVTYALGYTPGTGGGSVTSVGMSVPSFLSVTPSTITTSGSFSVTLSGTALPITSGGTGQTTTTGSLNALLPSQTGNAGKTLTTDGTNVSWSAGVQTTPSGSAVLGTGSLATTATNGFAYIPTMAGVPTGVPTAITGYAPMVIDSTDNRLYVYIGGNWLAINVAVYS